MKFITTISYKKTLSELEKEEFKKDLLKTIYSIIQDFKIYESSLPPKLF